MALIKCPECGKDVSDRATTCIHCGYPLISTTTEQQTLVSSLSQVASSSPQPVKPASPTVTTSFALFSSDKEYVNIECKRCEKVYKYSRVKYFDTVTSDFCISNTPLQCSNCRNTAPAYSKIKAKINTVPISYVETLRCPRCNSTLVTTGQRGFSIWTGFWGSNKTVNRCGKCGFTWKP